MRRLLFTCLFLLPYFSFSQQTFIIKGFVKNKSAKPIIFATIVDIVHNISTLTDTNGFFSILLPEGQTTLVASSVGFHSDTVNIVITSLLNLTFELVPNDFLEEIVIQDDKFSRTLNSTQMGMVSVSAKEAKMLPAILGEQNIIKALQLKPGVQSASEGGVGYFVRGGGPGQNLILLDDAVVYNANHILGFFSLFNSEVIHKADLYKGGFPSKYGGRLSSILSLTTKNPSFEKKSISGGVALTGARILLETPIKKNRSSIFFAGRSTYLNLFSKRYNQAYKENPRFNPVPDYYFYDFNLKATIKLSSKDILTISGFYGLDNLNFSQNLYNFQIEWANIIGSINWKRKINENLTVNSILYTSRYKYNLENTIDNLKLTLGSGVNSVTHKSDFSYIPNSTHFINFGYYISNLNLNAVNYNAGYSNGKIIESTKRKMKGKEAGIYFSDEISITHRLSINAGTRLSSFFNNKAYFNIEPRFSTRYKITSSSSLKVAYSRMAQYLQLLSISGASLPTDIWRIPNDHIKPQISDQISLGADNKILQEKLFLNVEIFYKKLQNQIDFNNSTSVLISESLDTEFAKGKGWSYGSEFYLEKRSGSFTGWVSYTLSWSWLQFPQINEGLKFPSRFDRRHDISVAFFQKISKRLSLSSTWVFGTGNAITLPVSRFAIQDVIGSDFKVVPEYTSRNSFRMPSYHRLDLGISWKFFYKKGEGDLSFSIYNVYNRRNAYFIYFDFEKDNRGNIAKFFPRQVSLFPIIPSIAYNLKF